jgi:MFS transporter, DHA1 family, multidrug resistance protein
MLDLVREAPIGVAIRFLSRNRLLQHPEERADFQLPAQYAAILAGEKITPHDETPPELANLEKAETIPDIVPPSTTNTLTLDLETMARITSLTSVKSVPYSNERMRNEQMLSIERTKTIPILPQKTEEGVILVDWYTTDDPANPHNWSTGKKNLVVAIIAVYTWVVYCTGPVYAASEFGGLAEHFGISPVFASLGLSMYTLAYGLGDLLFSPITEIPVVGRNSVYYLTFIVFFALSFGPPVVDSYGGLLAFRFFLGFFGSPALANGGATIGDVYDLIYIPYGLCWWVFSAWCGPALGPLIGGYAAMAKGWRWPMWCVTCPRPASVLERC